MRQPKFFRGTLEFLGKLASIVRLNIFNVSVKEVMDTAQEISGMFGVLSWIHPRKSNLGMGVYACYDIPLEAGPMPHHHITGNKEACSCFFFEFRNALFRLIAPAFFSERFSFLWMEIEGVFFNHPLDFPGRDVFLMFFLIEPLQFLFAPAEMLPPERKNAEFFQAGYLPLTCSLGTPAFLFQRFKMMGIVSPLPYVEGFASDAEITAGFSDILGFVVIIHPFQPFPGFRAKLGQRSQRLECAQAVYLCEVHRGSIPPGTPIVYSFMVIHLARPKCHRCISSFAILFFNFVSTVNIGYPYRYEIVLLRRS